MKFNLNCDIKYKDMSFEDIKISLDRLSRFKNPEIKYRRVFYDIILKHLLSPSVSKHKLNEQNAAFVVDIVERIWNNSVKKLFPKSNGKCFALKDLDFFQYNIQDSYTKELMSAKLNISDVLKSDLSVKLPLNLLFLKKLATIYKNDNDIAVQGRKIREEFKTLFPVEKLILTEGITEEILLPKFGEISEYDFNKNGVFVLATGGKSKVLSIYAELKYILKIPVFVILDNDAEVVYKDVQAVLREQDKCYLIHAGEFEDILSKDLIKKAFSDMNYDVQPATDEEISSEDGTCGALENLWKSRGLGEFRKAHFAKAVAKCLNSREYITEEIDCIINTIKNL